MTAKTIFATVVVTMVLLAAGAVQANVFDMGGTRNADGSWTGIASLETVPVGNPGNAVDTRYATPGYGSVAYTYNIGKYEVTAGQYTEFLNKVAKTDTYGLYNTSMGTLVSGMGCNIKRTGLSGSYVYSVDANWTNHPVDVVSWGDAARFANWLHNGQPTGAQGLTTTEDGAYYLNGATTSANLLAVSRKSDWKWAITSENEWYKAAYYKGGGTNAGYFDYPTSSDTAPGRDLADVSGNNANILGTPYPIISGQCTTVVGEFQNSDSPYGTFDQGGNNWEWNEAVIGSDCGVRGGSYGSTGDFVNLRPSDRSLHYSPTDEYYSLGFRVSATPEPATLSLLALGGLALLRRCWKTDRSRPASRC